MRAKCPTVLRKAVSLKSSKHFTLELKERTKRQGSYLGAKKERFRSCPLPVSRHYLRQLWECGNATGATSAFQFAASMYILI